MKLGWGKGPEPNVSLRSIFLAVTLVATLGRLVAPAIAQPLPIDLVTQPMAAIASPPITATVTSVPHAGLFWAVKLEAPFAVQRERIRLAVEGRAWVVWSEAQLVSCPQLVELSREANPGCQVFLSINGWGVFDNGSVYWPSHKLIADVATASNGWLTDAAGNRLRTSFGIALVDIRVAAVRDVIAASGRQLIAKTGADGIFIDEAYAADWPSHYSGRDLSVGRPDEDPSIGWTESIVKLIRKVGARETIINGTLPAGASPFVTGRYIQNADQAAPGTVLVWLSSEAQAIPPARRKICLQVAVGSSLFWQAIAATVPGTAIQEIPTGPTNQFDAVRPAVMLKSVRATVDLSTRSVELVGAN